MFLQKKNSNKRKDSIKRQDEDVGGAEAGENLVQVFAEIPTRSSVGWQTLYVCLMAYRVRR